ncbi:MAG: GTP cyclohydrolase II [bacterium]|nr:GTP cyclohydrolase II [bacterium]
MSVTRRIDSNAHVVLTSHPEMLFKDVIHIDWGAKNPKKRGPVIATLSNRSHRNTIGTHSGSYMVYRALAHAAGGLSRDHIPDLTDTLPPEEIGPFPSWYDPERIVCLDPLGHLVADVFKDHLKQGYDIRPSIAVTKAHISMMEISDAVRKGRLEVDGKIIKENHDVRVTKAAVEPVWYIPGIAKRFGVDEGQLRRVLFQDTGGMFPELVTRPDLKIFLPPIGSTTVYIFGDVKHINDSSRKLTCRVHDECNGSDVFGSDICTCRPYLTHGIEEAVRCAQEGGSGVIVYFRKEGRSLGEVTKFLVYNARKRQEGGDTAANYFYRTECVAGVQDARFQELMPDVLNWLGIQRIDRLISMSDMKHDAITGSGIEVVERVPLPDDLIPGDAKVEIEAKKAAGYFTPEGEPTSETLESTKGRKLHD